MASNDWRPSGRALKTILLIQKIWNVHTARFYGIACIVTSLFFFLLKRTSFTWLRFRGAQIPVRINTVWVHASWSGFVGVTLCKISFQRGIIWTAKVFEDFENGKYTGAKCRFNLVMFDLITALLLGGNLQCHTLLFTAKTSLFDWNQIQKTSTRNPRRRRGWNNRRMLFFGNSKFCKKRTIILYCYFFYKVKEIFP